MDKVALETPSVYIDFEYLLSEGYNEQALGFITDGKVPALGNLVLGEPKHGHNFFLAVGPQDHDILKKNLGDFYTPHLSVVGIGNAFLNQYVAK